jgi:hypothetical protein
VKKRSRVGLWLLVGFLLATGAAAIVAILFPAEVKQGYQIAKERLRPWIVRAKEATFGTESEPEAPPATTQQPATQAEGAGDPSSGESKPAETSPEPTQAPPLVAETPPATVEGQ